MSKTLTVYLAADTSRLTRGLRQGQSDLGMFESSVGKLAAVMGAAFTVDKVVGFFQDSAAAALDDQKAMVSLNQTLSNMGFASASLETQQFIDSMQRSTGVADDMLRPAMDRLIRSSASVGEAQKMLSLAMDISAGSGKDLQSVTDALGKAMDGSTTALGKLGLGIDKNIIQSGNMEAITATAAKTFEGQAAAAAETYQGKINRVTVSVNEAKEAIGYALLKALDDASSAMGGTGGFTSQIDKFGKDAANAIGGVGLLTTALSRLGAAAPGFADQFGVMGRGIETAIQNQILGPAYAAMQLLGQLNNFFGNTFEIGGGQFDQTVGRNQKSLANLDHEALNAALDTRALAEYQGWVEAQSKKTTGATNVLTDALAAQSDVINTTVTGLKSQTTALEQANKAVTDYAQTIADQILGGVNLGDAYKAQFDDAGKKTGRTLVEAFQAQVDQATWFGNVLTAIKQQGADQSLIEQIASLGPEAGGALGQQMLDEGLVPTINDQWTGVQSTVAGLAMGLVPEFLLAGQESALQLVNGTVEQLQKEEKRLRQIGVNIGKPIGANIKSEIAQAVAEAVKAAEAAKSAAAAERASQAAQTNVTVSEQQVAQALNRLIVNSNARTGYPANNPPAGIVFG